MAGRISVSENQEFTAMTPAKRPAQVILHFKDGQQREKTVDGSKGDPDQPMSAVELEAKFHTLYAPRLGKDRSQKAWNELGQLDQRRNLDVLVEKLAPREREPNELPLEPVSLDQQPIVKGGV